jgi:hypothetical protein
MKIKNISIIDPATGRPVSLEDWKKVENPTSAEKVLIETDELAPFCVSKTRIEERKTWPEAVEAGAPTRAQALAIYNARHAGLGEALKLIGGDEAVEITWTCDEDKDPNYATHAWTVYLDDGYVNANTKTRGIRVRPVSAFNPSDFEL